MSRTENSLTSGLFSDNTVLSACMVTAPVIICGDTLKNALALSVIFTILTFVTVMLTSFVPKKLPYAAKIIIYALTASLLYIPLRMGADEYFAGISQRIGIFFPLLAVNSLITVHSEAKFFRMKRLRMTGSLIFSIIGFDAVMLFTGFARELIGYGTVYGKIMDMSFVVSGLSKPFGGFIFLGIICGIYRRLRAEHRKNKENQEGDTDAVC